MQPLPLPLHTKQSMDISAPGSTKGNVIDAEPHLALAAEDQPRELVQRPFHIGEGDAVVHGQALNLVEVPLVGGVRGLVAVALAGHHHPNGRLAGPP